MSAETTNAKLVDLRTVSIDRSLSKEEKLKAFIDQIKDPHHFRVGDTEVKVSYSGGGKSLDDCFLQMLQTLTKL